MTDMHRGPGSPTLSAQIRTLLRASVALLHAGAALSWERLRDVRRTVRVALALEGDPFLSRAAIAAEVRGGTVTLSGWVESPHALEAAVELVRGLPGVRRVRYSVVVGRRRGRGLSRAEDRGVAGSWPVPTPAYGSGFRSPASISSSDGGSVANAGLASRLPGNWRATGNRALASNADCDPQGEWQ